MKINPIFCSFCLLMTSLAVQAAPILVVGTPGDLTLSTPTGPTPRLTILANFDSLTPDTGAAFNPSTYSSVGLTISSSNGGLTVISGSSQSSKNSPNELWDDTIDNAPGDGSANILIQYAPGTAALGFGIADFDPVLITIQPLAQDGSNLGSAFTINPQNNLIPSEPGNGYYVVEDSSADIFGVLITQAGGANNSGLAIDDVAVAPEPSTLMLFATGIAILGFLRLRRG